MHENENLPYSERLDSSFVEDTLTFKSIIKTSLWRYAYCEQRSRFLEKFTPVFLPDRLPLSVHISQCRIPVQPLRLQ